MIIDPRQFGPRLETLSTKGIAGEHAPVQALRFAEGGDRTGDEISGLRGRPAKSFVQLAYFHEGDVSGCSKDLNDVIHHARCSARHRRVQLIKIKAAVPRT